MLTQGAEKSIGILPIIREATAADLPAVLALYAQLHPSAPVPEPDAAETWARILADRRQHVLLADVNGEPAATCTLVVVPNLTHGLRPWAIIENVVTRADARGRGLGTAVLSQASALARELGCYKIMLMTGHKDEATLRFYEGAGFNRRDKTAMILWLNESAGPVRGPETGEWKP